MRNLQPPWLSVSCLASGSPRNQTRHAHTPSPTPASGRSIPAIYVADADGSHERMLLERSVLDMNPSFSPDGRSVLFTSRRNGSADIYRVRIDGSRLEQLTDDPAFDDQAVMSPDGRAWRSSRRAAVQADVWVLDLASRGCAT